MNIFYILLVSIGSFCMLQYVLLPAFNKKSENEENILRFIKLKVIGAVLEFLKTFLLFAVIAYGGFLIIFGIIWVLHLGDTISDLEMSISFIQDLSKLFGSVSTTISVVIFILIITTLIYITQSKVKQTYEMVLGKIFSEKFSDTKAAYIRNEVDHLPPTKEMSQIIGEIEKLENQKIQSQQALVNKEISQDEFDYFNEKVEDSIQKLRTIYYQIDIERRINITPEELKSAKKLAFGNNFFIGNDFLGFFEKTGKWGYRFGLILLFLSLISVGGFQMNDELSDKKNDLEGIKNEKQIELDNIQIAKNKEDAKKKWDATKNKFSSEESTFTEEDKELLNDLADEIESKILDGLEPVMMDSAHSNSLRHSKTLLKSLNVRNRILERATDVNLSGEKQKVRANAESLDANSSMSRVDELTSIEKDVLETYEKVDNPRNIKPSLKQKIQTQLMNELKNKPQLWNEIKPKIIAHKASNAYSKEVAGISRKMFNSIMNNSIKISGVDAISSGNELSILGQNLVKKIGTESLENFFEIKLNNFLSNTVHYVTIEEALKNINSTEIQNLAINEKIRVELATFKRSLPNETDIIPKIKDKPPSINAKMGQAEYIESVKTLSKMKQLRAAKEFTDLLTITESISSYGDFFSPQKGHGSKTVRGRQLASWDPEGFSKSSKVFTGSFNRSRSFVRLRGFSRIGGVLIGHEKEYSENEMLNFVGLDWKDSNGKLLLTLAKSNGEKIELGPFKKSLINHALTYVADGRPVAVTMITVDPLFDLKILLHPAFVDTRFGCRVIEIDRFVDKYAGLGFEERVFATQKVEAQAALYKLAVKARFDALLEYLLDNTYDSDEKKMILKLKNEDRFSLTYQELSNCKFAISNTAKFWNENNLLKEKLDFYDNKLYSLIDKSIKSGVESIEKLEDALLADFSHELKLNRPSGAELEKYFTSPPEYQIWSGVREKDFSIDENLDFLRFGDSHYGSFNNYPLEFMLQVSFTSEPEFSNDYLQEEYFDKEPFEFGSLSTTIMQRIISKIDKHDLSVMHDLGEFTILQRLFRTIFNGGFGDNFPLEKLYDLADITTESVQFCKTLSWNPKPGLLELLLLRQMEEVQKIFVVDGNEPWISDYLKSLSVASEFLKSNENRLSHITMSEWNKKLSFEKYDEFIYKYENDINFDETKKNPDIDLILLIHKKIKNASLARQLRFDLNVDEPLSNNCAELK